MGCFWSLSDSSKKVKWASSKLVLRCSLLLLQREQDNSASAVPSEVSRLRSGLKAA